MKLISPRERLSPDGAAVARSLADPEAFAEIFDRHFATVHRYIARRADRQTADDLASQVFTLAFAHRGRYRDDLGTARPWLFGIATNLLRAESRGARRRLALVGRLRDQAVVSSPEPAPGCASAVSGDDNRLTSALATLHPDLREALLLHALADLTYVEVSAALAIPIGTVRSRISRACAALRLELDPPSAGERRNHARGA